MTLPPDEPVDQGSERDGADHQQGRDGLAAFLPNQDPEHDAAHAYHGQHCADEVDLPRSGVRDIAD
jgi:hypothetical protein